MAANPTINTLSDAVLLDNAFGIIQPHLENQLGWLNSAYGKAERRVRIKDGREIYYPAVYANKRDYLAVFPDSHLGNFSFFDIKDGYEIEYRPKYHYKLRVEFGLVFWFDFRTVYPFDHRNRTAQNIIERVMNAFYLLSNVAIKRLEVLKIWERPDNIYPGYTHREVDNQFLMRPYGGFRLDMRMSYLEPCDPCQLEGVNYWIVEDDNIVQP